MRKLRERLALMPAVVRTLLLILAAILLAGLVWLPTWAGAAPAAAVTDVGTLPESQPTDLLLEGAPLDTRYTLVLDAGHGGIDGGAVDTTGTVLEKDVNQTMVDKVTALLAAHANQLRVVQAVEPDTNATVLARANTAVKEQADLFLSLHLNGDTHESSRGFQCFPTPPGRPYADESLRFARLLVSEIKLYNENQVAEGRRNRDLYSRLKRDVDRSREMYEKRVSPSVSCQMDYFHEEIIRILGDNDPSTLGSEYPGSRVES